MLKGGVVNLIQSKIFKTVVFILGVLLLISTVFISINPEPFLKFGYAGVFLFNLFGPGTLLIPTLSLEMNIPLIALFSATGMTLNDSLSWVVGTIGNDVIPPSSRVERIELKLKKHGAIYLFLWSLIPFPYDIIGFIAGYLDFKYLKFALPTILGKFIRFLVIGYGVTSIFSLIALN
jgi:membrane protein YqaA with SNARE-associated domain